MQSSHAIVVGDVDPGPELVLEGGIVFVVFEILSCKGLEVQNVYFEFG